MIAAMGHAFKAGRNELCPCGSGKKFKKCHAAKQQNARTSKLLLAAIIAALIGALYAGYAGFGDEGSLQAAPGKVWSPEHGHYH